MRQPTRSAAVVATLVLLGTASGVSIVEPRKAEQQVTYDVVVVLLATAADTHTRRERSSQHRGHHAHSWASHDWSWDRSNFEVGVDATASEEAGAGVHVVIPARTDSDVVLRSLPRVYPSSASCS